MDKIEQVFHWMMTALMSVSMTAIYYSSLTAVV